MGYMTSKTTKGLPRIMTIIGLGSLFVSLYLIQLQINVGSGTFDGEIAEDKAMGLFRIGLVDGGSKISIHLDATPSTIDVVCGLTTYDEWQHFYNNQSSMLSCLKREFGHSMNLEYETNDQQDYCVVIRKLAGEMNVVTYTGNFEINKYQYRFIGTLLFGAAFAIFIGFLIQSIHHIWEPQGTQDAPRQNSVGTAHTKNRQSYLPKSFISIDELEWRVDYR